MNFRKYLSVFILLLLMTPSLFASSTRLLRQPSISDSHIAFTYASDVWVSDLDGSNVTRITSTPAVESDPHISPDEKMIAFTSNRFGSNAVFVVSITGGTPKRLTWHPSDARVRGWTVDGKRVLYSTSREATPKSIDRLWTISTTGGPGELLTKQWSTDGAFSRQGDKIVIDRVNRWDEEWRAYRGGQNTSLIVLDLNNHSEILIPNEQTTDIQPLWIDDTIYFLSDRDYVMNIWYYKPITKELKQVTHFKGSDVKWLAGKKDLIFERDGFLHVLDLSTNEFKQLNITVTGDFPWAEEKWIDVGKSIQSASLSPQGKRAVMEARGEIFTVPVEHGNVRNLTQSNDAADRRPLWSPKGDKIAWFSDAGQKEYKLFIANQDGLSEPESISIGISKLAWEPAWSPDGKYIAFVDDDLRVRVLDVEKKSVKTIDTGGLNIERGSMGVSWAPDSKWLAYSKSGSNYFRKIMIWSADKNEVKALTNKFADAFSPSWDQEGKHLYFLASTDVALGSGWANTSAMNSEPKYAAYIVNLDKSDKSPFKPKSDEEVIKKEKEKKDKKNEEKKDDGKKDDGAVKVTVDFKDIDRRIIPLSIPQRNYPFIYAGPKESTFIGERIENKEGLTLHKFTLEEAKLEEFISGISNITLNVDGSKILLKQNNQWKMIDASGKKADEGKTLKTDLQVKLNHADEWKQIFEEAWRYERDYFYDKNMHGRDWKIVYNRYAPLVPYIKHRADLNYILDQVNGELSVGHSFVFGGDYPEIDHSKVGLLGADFVAVNDCWQIKRIYTTENWNPGLTSPLDQPGIKIKEGNYLVGVNGEELTVKDNLFKALDGTLDQQTVVHINDKPEFKGSWQEIVTPIRSENNLRQRTWVEDNRRLVDQLSDGKLAYVWVPNTSMQGLISFNRYFFAQQDKEGAIIDERFNGGGLLDDYMVDLMQRTVRAAYTNEVPNGKPGVLPAGILGPKVLLINEMSGSGGDFFPWVFKRLKIGPLVGSTT